MGQVQLSAEQASAIAAWSADGPEMAPVVLLDCAPSYVEGWQDGDAVALQGDAHVHLSFAGSIKDAVPPVTPD